MSYTSAQVKEIAAEYRATSYPNEREVCVPGVAQPAQCVDVADVLDAFVAVLVTIERRLNVSFIQRELDRVRTALHAEQLAAPSTTTYTLLYAVQQALSWALEPSGYRSPFDWAMNLPLAATPEMCPTPSSGSPEEPHAAPRTGE